MGSSNNNKKRNNKNTKLIIKILKTPIRVIVKARDYYVKSMTELSLSGRVSSMSMAMGLPPDPLPRSFSINSARSFTNGYDFRELVRIASVKSLGTDHLLRKEQMPITEISRGRTVAFGRIDEDEEYEFSANNKVKVTGSGLYPRSKSVANPPKRTTVVF